MDIYKVTYSYKEKNHTFLSDYTISFNNVTQNEKLINMEYLRDMTYCYCQILNRKYLKVESVDLIKRITGLREICEYKGELIV